MPNLDLADVIEDEDFCDAFSVLRMTKEKSKGGTSDRSTETLGPFIGIVTPATSEDLKRVPEIETVDGAITVISQFPFIVLKRLEDGRSISADIVVYPTTDGTNYTVININDYTRFGAGDGWNTATCKKVDLP